MRCEPASDFTVAKAIAWRSSIDDDPTYQRAGDVWSIDQRQLFIDSLLNGYDVPKIYLHDLRGEQPNKVYAVVDGKQRLSAMWSFVRDGFPLAPDFRIEGVDVPDVAIEAPRPEGGVHFSAMDVRWRTALLRTPLSVVLIRNATEADIEELFSRLNNGVALSPAERRNAFGGATARLIREVVATSDLFRTLGFGNERGEHLEVAARLLAWLDARGTDDVEVGDIDGAALDDFVKAGRRLSSAETGERARSLDRLWASVAARFEANDPRLANPDRAVQTLARAWRALDEQAPALRPASRAVAQPAAVGGNRGATGRE